MAKGTGRKPGRPRKIKVEEKPMSTPEMAGDFLVVDEEHLTEVSRSDTPIVVDPAVESTTDPCPFTEEERGRIRTCDDVYLVTKNAERLSSGARDKQVHNAAWLRGVV